MSGRTRAAIVVLIVVISVTGVAVLFVGPGQPPATRYLTASVRRGDVVREAVADGTVQAASTYGLTFGRSPQLVVADTTVGVATAGAASVPGAASWHVTSVLAVPGQRVAKGTVLAMADAGVARQQLAVARANLAAANARLALDRAGPSAADRASAYGSVRQAQAQLAQARASLSSAQSQNSLAVDQAQAALERATQTYADDVAAGAPQEVRDADQKAITAAQDGLDLAVARSTSSNDTAQAAVSDADRSLSAAQDGLASAQARANLDRLALDSANAKLMNDTATGAVAAVLAADQQAVAQAEAAVNADLQAATQAQTAITAAQAQLDQAKRAATNATGTNDLTIRQAQAALARAQQQYADDLAKGAPKAVLEADRSAVTGTTDTLATAKARASAAIEAGRAQLDTASAGLTAARDAYTARVAPAPSAQVAADLAQVATAKQAVTAAQDAVADSTLVAPVAGTVVEVDLEAGVDAPAGYGILLQSERLQVVADFAESDKAALAVGLPARIEIPALAATTDGRVLEVKPVASGGTPGRSVVTYEALVDLPSPPAGIAVGMSAHAAVATARATGVLVVPSIAVGGSEGAYTVRVLDASGRPQIRTVGVGLASSDLTEITSGLDVGQEIVVGTTSDRARVSFSGGGGFGPSPTPAASTGPGGS